MKIPSRSAFSAKVVILIAASILVVLGVALDIWVPVVLFTGTTHVPPIKINVEVPAEGFWGWLGFKKVVTQIYPQGPIRNTYWVEIPFGVISALGGAALYAAWKLRKWLRHTEVKVE